MNGLIRKIALIVPLAFAVTALAEESAKTESTEAAGLRNDAKQDFQKAKKDRAKASEKAKQEAAEAGKARGEGREAIIDANKEHAEGMKDYNQARQEAKDARREHRENHRHK